LAAANISADDFGSIYISLEEEEERSQCDLSIDLPLDFLPRFPCSITYLGAKRRATSSEALISNSYPILLQRKSLRERI